MKGISKHDLRVGSVDLNILRGKIYELTYDDSDIVYPVYFVRGEDGQIVYFTPEGLESYFLLFKNLKLGR